MTDTIDTLNDEINGGMNALTKALSGKMQKGVSSAEFREGLGKGASVIGEGLGKGASTVGKVASYAYQNSDFYVVLFTLNFISSSFHLPLSFLL